MVLFMRQNVNVDNTFYCLINDELFTLGKIKLLIFIVSFVVVRVQILLGA
jgi:hypothetical protein